ncbi:unnamed protein product, partial [Closterium sp. NIES-54]
GGMHSYAGLVNPCLSHSSHLPSVHGMSPAGKYDVAISTACGALEYIVVDNIETAQACTALLRERQLGVQTFLALVRIGATIHKPWIMERARSLSMAHAAHCLSVSPSHCLSVSAPRACPQQGHEGRYSVYVHASTPAFAFPPDFSPTFRDALIPGGKAKRDGSIPGIYGRLGDLGAIDGKYDVAISTACGALEYIVVDNIETAQACTALLRERQLGVQTFLALDKQQHLVRDMSEKVSTPEGVPRLPSSLYFARHPYIHPPSRMQAEGIAEEDVEAAGLPWDLREEEGERQGRARQAAAGAAERGGGEGEDEEMEDDEGAEHREGGVGEAGAADGGDGELERLLARLCGNLVRAVMSREEAAAGEQRLRAELEALKGNLNLSSIAE